MSAPKKHILLNGYYNSQQYSRRASPQQNHVPFNNQSIHGRQLLSQYQQALTNCDRNRPTDPIMETTGVYVELKSQIDISLPLDSLDNRDFILKNFKIINNQEIVTVFISDDKRQKFANKIIEYADQSKNKENGNPKNHRLIDSILEIRLADLKSFWTDDLVLFPNDGQEIWWEIWLTANRRNYDVVRDIAFQLAERIDATLGNTSLTFFNSIVFLIKATARQLETAPELISSLQELRRAKEVPDTIINSSLQDQRDWSIDLADRIEYRNNISSAVSILDTGVNYNHPILRNVCSYEFSEVFDSTWPNFDNTNPHGSWQAGLAAFGDLQASLLTNQNIIISHYIESGRILPPRGANEPELYGYLTIDTAYKLEIARPELKRVYSLAVTADSHDGGLPSSWSAEIDLFTSGFADNLQRLFVVSAGNNRKQLSPTVDYWDQVHLAEIEDPAQAWNALTVGAYTEKTTNDDPSLNGWSPFACFGDVSPASRSSVNWQWKRIAPYKPEIVAEGGNRLLSPDCRFVTQADTVSLLTTSGNTTGQLFEPTGDTSAASALVARQAAILMTEYPDYWPETIRGLLVHSAAWTNRMKQRYEALLKLNRHTPTVAKDTMLRTVGYGVTNLDKARYSANHSLTLIAQNQMRPFTHGKNVSDNPRLNEMHLYQLPWPKEALAALPLELDVQLKITLSYFIEPNPSRKGDRGRYSYPSHGLRFSVIRPNQTLENFNASINFLAQTDDYDGPDGDARGWAFGPKLRNKGSIHSDVWSGSAADLAEMNTIAVYPVGGWWKFKAGEDRYQNNVRYTLIVSIETPDENIDIYSIIENMVNVEVQT
ncbi:S8 family peptidase [Agitococcus lubricus]|uniref:Subtilase family protein n=1 Tax=Agitococcus lubricus TaxID=1077255 RepID=A0A2T5ISK0_9GAMM|nr:S8 family peptidase [Agitococcus lubricus]PTQ86801.1 subtilase family protein [Agitococcus lubricus]